MRRGRPRRPGPRVGGRLLRLAEKQAQAQGFNEERPYSNAAMTENLTYYPRHGCLETHRATQDGYRRVFLTNPVMHVEPDVHR